MKRFLGNLVLVILAIGTVTAALEIAARILPRERLPGSLPMIVQAMQLHADALYIRDPNFRYITKPNLDVKVEHPDFTYRAVTKLNFEQAGFRGGTLGGPVWGIALGDSTTFGMGVDHQATWVGQLAHLAEREIINLGVPGWGPQQYTLALERYGTSLAPKIILYTLYRNDLQDVLHFERWLKDRTLLYRLSNLLGQHSVTYNLFTLLAEVGWRTRQRNISLDTLEVTFDSKALSNTLSEDRRIFSTAWSLVEREIERSIRYSNRINAKLVLLQIPSKGEAYWELITRETPALKALDDSVEIIRRNLENFCARRKLACVDPTPALRRKASQGEKLYFSTDSHVNKNGNRLIAQQVYHFLLTNKMLP